MAKLSDVQIAAVAQDAWGITLMGEIPTAVAVALAESGGNSAAVNRANANGSVDYGLFQINTVHQPRFSKMKFTNSQSLWDARMNPVANARMAYQVYKNAGRSWRPWYAWRDGKHLKYMERGRKAAGELNKDAGWKGWLELLKKGAVSGLDPDAGIPGGVPGGKEWLADLMKTLDFLTDPKNWLRVGMILGGVLLMGIVTWTIVKETKAYKAAKSAATLAVTKGMTK